MTRRIYTDICLLFKGAGADVLPTYENLDKFRKEDRPPIQELQDPYQGIKFNYEEALKLTTSQLLKSINLPVIHILEEVHLTVHDGLDGSGGHSIFNQKGSGYTKSATTQLLVILIGQKLNFPLLIESEECYNFLSRQKKISKQG